MPEVSNDVGVDDKGVGDLITRKIGPLPAWGWLLVGVGGYFIYKKFGGSLSGHPTPSDNTAAEDTTLGTTGSIDTPNDALVAIETSLANLTAMAEADEAREAKETTAEQKEITLLEKLLKRRKNVPPKKQPTKKPPTNKPTHKKTSAAAGKRARIISPLPYDVPEVIVGSRPSSGDMFPEKRPLNPTTGAGGGENRQTIAHHHTTHVVGAGGSTNSNISMNVPILQKISHPMAGGSPKIDRSSRHDKKTSPMTGDSPEIGRLSRHEPKTDRSSKHDKKVR